jgi:hypothetical protein
VAIGQYNVMKAGRIENELGWVHMTENQFQELIVKTLDRFERNLAAHINEENDTHKGQSDDINGIRKQISALELSTLQHISNLKEELAGNRTKWAIVAVLCIGAVGWLFERFS